MKNEWVHPSWLEAQAPAGPDTCLMALWMSVQDLGSPALAFALGAVCALESTAMVSPVIARLWRIALSRCPGHETGRTWCAYCGDLSVKTDDRDDPCPVCGGSGAAVAGVEPCEHCKGTGHALPRDLARAASGSGTSDSDPGVQPEENRETRLG